MDGECYRSIGYYDERITTASRREMSKRLNENLSSGYFQAANRMISKHARRRIVAYVESYDDIYFWRTVLNGFENDTRYFEVMLPSRNNKLERGKKAALMNLLGLRVGEDMIACVDADYDYLLQRVTPMSEAVLDNPYVFHTYAYSIENLQCYAQGLHDVCVAATLNDHAIFDFVDFLSRFSEAIFPLFVWNIWCYRYHHYSHFTLTDFNRVIETGHFGGLHHSETIIENLRKKVGRKVLQLQRSFPNARNTYAQVKTDLKSLGVTPTTTYLYIQGHHLFDSLVAPLLTKVCERLIREREEEIRHQALHATQLRNELAAYNHSLIDLSIVLRKGNGYVEAVPFKQIQADIARFLANTSGENPDSCCVDD